MWLGPWNSWTLPTNASAILHHLAISSLLGFLPTIKYFFLAIVKIHRMIDNVTMTKLSKPNSDTMRPRSKRKKTLLGCWTCRSRHVKCDEAKPTCQRCRNARRICEGYEHKFAWIREDGYAIGYRKQMPVNGEPAEKRCTGLTHYPLSLHNTFPNHTIANFLGDLDDFSVERSAQIRGPFSMFPLAGGHDELPWQDSQLDSAPKGEPSRLSIEVSSSENASEEGYSLYSIETISPDLSKVLAIAQTEPFTPCQRFAAEDRYNLAGTIIQDKFNSSIRFSTVSHLPATAEMLSSLRSEPPRTVATQPSLVNTDSRIHNQCLPYVESIHSLIYDEIPQLNGPHQPREIDSMPTTILFPLDTDQQSSSLPVDAHGMPTWPSWSSIKNPLPKLYQELIHHWATTLSGHMLATDSKDNMTRTVWLPIALEGLYCVPQYSSGSLSLFHSICSAAAQNLYVLHGSSIYYLNASLKHQHLSLHHLRCCVSLRQKSTDLSLLLAMMGCFVVETMSGRAGGWRAHLQACFPLLSDMSYNENSCPYLTKTIQVLLAIAAVCGLIISPDVQAALLQRLPDDQDYLLTHHGISHGTIKLLLFIHNANASEIPINVQQLELLEWQLNLEVPTTSDSQNSGKTGRMRHIASAFHFAALIYARRALGRANDETVPSLTKAGLESLEAAEAVGEPGSEMLWPILVVAAECDNSIHQARILRLLSQKKRFGSGHIKVLTEYVAMQWRKAGCGRRRPFFSCRELATSAGYDVPPV